MQVFQQYSARAAAPSPPFVFLWTESLKVEVRARAGVSAREREREREGGRGRDRMDGWVRRLSTFKPPVRVSRAHLHAGRRLWFALGLEPRSSWTPGVLGLTDFPGIPLAKERWFLRVFSKFLQDHGARADPPCAHAGITRGRDPRAHR